MTAVSKNVCIAILEDIVDKYKNTYHKIIKIKPAVIKSDTYINFAVENNDKDTKFKVYGNVRISNKDTKFKVYGNVRISKHKYIFANGYTPNLSVEVIEKVENTGPWT